MRVAGNGHGEAQALRLLSVPRPPAPAWTCPAHMKCSLEAQRYILPGHLRETARRTETIPKGGSEAANTGGP